MRCKRCSSDAVLEQPSLCEKHFIPYFERKVYHTIDRFRLVKKKDKVMVACSGGKDSTVLLHLLAEKGYDVHALAIDEGIKGYRDKTLAFLRRFCFERGIALKEVSYKDALGISLDQMMKHTGRKPCNVCGVYRRHLLNKHARGFDVLTTGHNLDDEAQSIMMNLLLNNSNILPRLGPRTGVVQDSRFVPRVKPLYLMREKEVMAYSYIKGLLTEFSECPNIVDSFRAEVRDFLNTYEITHPGFKEDLVSRFISALPRLKGNAKLSPIGSCSICQEPSASAVCSACSLRKELGLRTVKI